MYIECVDFIVSTITIRWVIDSMLAWVNFCLLDLLPTFHLPSSFGYLLIKIWPLTCLHACFFFQSACLLLLTLSLNFSSLSLDLSLSLLSFAYWKSTFVIFFNSLDLWVCTLTFDFLFSMMSEEPVHEAVLGSPWKYGFLIQNPQQPLLITLLYFLGRCPDLKVNRWKFWNCFNWS